MDSATTELEHIEKLAKEAECLKIRLEDERQKLNDITRNYQKILFIDMLITYKCLQTFLISFQYYI